MLHIVGPDGSAIDTDPASAKEILKQLKAHKNAVAARVDGHLHSLAEKVDRDAEIEPVPADSEEGLEILRHSTSHLMAQAVLRLFPGASLGIGPAIKEGFYYDIDIPEGLREDDLPRIEEEMRSIAREALPVERRVLPREEAIALFRQQGQHYKVELIEELPDEEISCYQQGGFIDLCRGPHVENTGVLQHFALLSLAGAYWRGDENNPMLTRIYGTAFPDKKSLKAYLNRLEEAKRRAHQKLGKELDLFSFHPEGPGFPFFHPKGMTIINTLVDFWRREHVKRGYDEIRTPLMLDKDLWIQSGHWDHYRENMYFTQIDEQDYAIKPMNCPGGIMVYKAGLHSYRELPMRVAELGTVHRHERSGVLHGLMRVRSFTQDDAHLYVTPQQLKDEIKGIMALDHYFYNDVFGFTYHVELSTKPEKAMGDPSLWEEAEQALQESLEEEQVPYKVNPGDGAFYGPKIDYHLQDCIGRTWQCGTIQVDFQMPEKFDLTYIGEDGGEHRPIMLHRTVYGSLERFLGILIEHYAGAFPFWLAPVQVRVLPVAGDHHSYADEVYSRLKGWGIRVECDRRDEKLGKRIRDAEVNKVPYMLVLGDRERESGQVSVREKNKGDLGSMTVPELQALFGGEFNPLAG
ncbi:MAG: threonine--tRNA ligase [Synergistales bacterium]|nr:threonine--tRNA ligase [Synergistales bacterium]